MTSTSSQTRSALQGKSLIALFATTALIAGGARALAPAQASAVIDQQTCETWFECEEANGGSGSVGGSGPVGGGSGGGDPFEGWQVDQTPTDNNPFEGWQKDAGDDQPHRGYLDDGTYYNGAMTTVDLVSLGKLPPADYPDIAYRGFLDDGTYYEGSLTKAELITLELLSDKEDPQGAAKSRSRRDERSKAHRPKPRHRGGR